MKNQVWISISFATLVNLASTNIAAAEGGQIVSVNINGTQIDIDCKVTHHVRALKIESQPQFKNGKPCYTRKAP